MHLRSIVYSVIKSSPCSSGRTDKYISKKKKKKEAPRFLIKLAQLQQKITPESRHSIHSNTMITWSQPSTVCHCYNPTGVAVPRRQPITARHSSSSAEGSGWACVPIGGWIGWVGGNAGGKEVLSTVTSIQLSGHAGLLGVRPGLAFSTQVCMWCELGSYEDYIHFITWVTVIRSSLL